MIPLTVVWMEGGVVHDIDSISDGAILLIDDQSTDGVDEDDLMTIEMGDLALRNERKAYVTLRSSTNFKLMFRGQTVLYSDLIDEARHILKRWERQGNRIVTFEMKTMTSAKRKKLQKELDKWF